LTALSVEPADGSYVMARGLPVDLTESVDEADAPRRIPSESRNCRRNATTASEAQLSLIERAVVAALVAAIVKELRADQSRSL
jgi:hypothetical protein